LEFPDVTHLDLKDEIDDKKVALMEEGEEFGEQTTFDQSDIKSVRIEQRNEDIKAVYEAADLTQAELGEIHGITQQQVNNIVNSA